MSSPMCPSSCTLVLLLVVVAASAGGAIQAESLHRGRGGWLGRSIPTLRLGARDGKTWRTLRLGGGGDGGGLDEEGDGRKEAASARKIRDWSGVVSVAKNAVKYVLGRVIGIQEERLAAVGEALGRRGAVDKSVIPSRGVKLPAARAGGDDFGEDTNWGAAEEGGSTVLRMPGAPKRPPLTAAGSLAFDVGFKAGRQDAAAKEEEEEEEEEVEVKQEKEAVEGLKVVKRSGKVLQKYPFGTEQFPKVDSAPVVVPPDKAPGAAMRDVDLNLTDIVSVGEREHGSFSDVVTRAHIRMRSNPVLGDWLHRDGLFETCFAEEVLEKTLSVSDRLLGSLDAWLGMIRQARGKLHQLKAGVQDGSVRQEEYTAAMADVRGAIEALEERQRQDREWMGMEIEEHPLTKLQKPDAPIDYEEGRMTPEEFEEYMMREKGMRPRGYDKDGAKLWGPVMDGLGEVQDDEDSRSNVDYTKYLKGEVDPERLAEYAEVAKDVLAPDMCPEDWGPGFQQAMKPFSTAYRKYQEEEDDKLKVEDMAPTGAGNKIGKLSGIVNRLLESSDEESQPPQPEAAAVSKNLSDGRGEMPVAADAGAKKGGWGVGGWISKMSKVVDKVLQAVDDQGGAAQGKEGPAGEAPSRAKGTRRVAGEASLGQEAGGIEGDGDDDEEWDDGGQAFTPIKSSLDVEGGGKAENGCKGVDESGPRIADLDVVESEGDVDLGEGDDDDDDDDEGAKEVVSSGCIAASSDGDSGDETKAGEGVKQQVSDGTGSAVVGALGDEGGKGVAEVVGEKSSEGEVILGDEEEEKEGGEEEEEGGGGIAVSSDGVDDKASNKIEGKEESVEGVVESDESVEVEGVVASPPAYADRVGEKEGKDEADEGGGGGEGGDDDEGEGEGEGEGKGSFRRIEDSEDVGDGLVSPPRDQKAISTPTKAPLQSGQGATSPFVKTTPPKISLGGMVTPPRAGLPPSSVPLPDSPRKPEPTIEPKSDSDSVLEEKEEEEEAADDDLVVESDEGGGEGGTFEGVADTPHPRASDVRVVVESGDGGGDDDGGGTAGVPLSDGVKDHVGGEKDHVGGERDHVGGEKDHVGGEKDHVGGEKDHVGVDTDGVMEEGEGGGGDEEEDGGEEAGVMGEEEIASSSKDSASVADDRGSSGSEGVMMSSDQGEDEVMGPAAKGQVGGFVPGAGAEGSREEAAEGKIHDVRQVIGSRDEDSASTTADEEGASGGKEGCGDAHATTGQEKQRGTSRDRGEETVSSKSVAHGQEEERGHEDEYASIDDEGEVSLRRYGGVEWDEEGTELKRGVLMQRKREAELGLVPVRVDATPACLYQTIAHALGRGAEDWKAVKSEIVEVLSLRKTYADAVSRESTWGGARELKAAAEAFGVQITWLGVDPGGGFSEQNITPASVESTAKGGMHIASIGRHFWPLAARARGDDAGRGTRVDVDSGDGALPSGAGVLDEDEGEWLDGWLLRVLKGETQRDSIDRGDVPAPSGQLKYGTGYGSGDAGASEGGAHVPEDELL